MQFCKEWRKCVKKNMAKEEDAIRKFVVRELHTCSDLSALTLGILRRRYLEKVRRESLSIKDRQLMKTIVEEELLKMQGSSDDEPLIKSVNPSKSQSKRKRVDDDEENNVVGKTKRSRLEESSPDSPDSGIEKAMNEREQKEEEAKSDKDTGEDSDEEQEKKVIKRKPQNKRRGKPSKEDEDSEKRKKPKKKGKMKDSDKDEESEDSDDEQESRQKQPSKEKKKKKDSVSEEEISDELSASDSEDEKVKTQSKRKDVIKKNQVERDVVKEVERQVFGSSSESEEENDESAKVKNSSNSEKDSEEEKDQKEDAAKLSSKEMEKNDGNVRDRQEEAAEDSDSSSLPSLEDEEEPEKDKKEGKKSLAKKKRSEEKEITSKGKDEEHKAVSRLKRYIALCGVRRNYKKLLDGCRSVKAKVAVLKKELEELGVEGNPSIEKCKRARLKREEAQELAELDVSNIITTQGRPKRRAAVAAWPPTQNVSPPPSAYKRVVDSDSDSGDSHTNTGCKRGAAWANLQGIISDDGESD
ncbi:HIRA-interacting protein 3-like [Carassius auratus]|uniref:HIRA-interacting protein 3-like n=1 Tax=Carassius auratus TaxID=7957 RepID=A0A6P6JIH3_CARAU|nr:HIRA-interacting protein 3-like [Carassius auratus]